MVPYVHERFGNPAPLELRHILADKILDALEVFLLLGFVEIIDVCHSRSIHGQRVISMDCHGFNRYPRSALDRQISARIDFPDLAGYADRIEAVFFPWHLLAIPDQQEDHPVIDRRVCSGHLFIVIRREEHERIRKYCRIENW